ncbi:Pex19 protein [Phlebopus sp. FC_14]|nr:Pex19 protein [Phlebopus sp. FC_14]
MESLLKELQASSPDQKGGDKDEGDQQRALAAAWEAMLVESMNGMMDPASKADAPASSPPPKAKDNDTFQSRIRSTVNKLKESESGLNTSDFGATGSEDSLEALLSKLGSGADAPESEEELQGVLEAMMGQLMSKEVLYEPLKELSEKFPGYILDNNSTISAEDKKRFDAQIVCIKKLLDAFEAGDYREDDDKSRQLIAELMGELQSHGSPPEEVMGPLPPGFSMGADGLPAGECTVS